MSARGSGHGRRPHQQHYQQLDRPVLAEQPSQRQRVRPEAGEDDELGDGAPPEWALLLIGCLLGLATGICVAAFNRGVSLRFLVIRMVDVAVGVAVHLSWFGCGVVGCNILGSLLLECITAMEISTGSDSPHAANLVPFISAQLTISCISLDKVTCFALYIVVKQTNVELCDCYGN